MLIIVGDEYRLQTRESAEWDADYRRRVSRILADDVRLASERRTILREALDASLQGLDFLQGDSKTPRKYGPPHFGPDKPAASSSSVPLWIQDGWSTSENGST